MNSKGTTMLTWTGTFMQLSSSMMSIYTLGDKHVTTLWRPGLDPQPLWMVGPPTTLQGQLPSVIRPLHTQDWEPMTVTLQALSLVEKAELVQVRFTLRLRDQRSMWMQDGCKVYMDSYMASNGSCFMVIWAIFKNLLLQVGLTQNRETMAL